MSKSQGKLRVCGGKRQYKTEEKAAEAVIVMTAKYNEDFMTYAHFDHFHIRHTDPNLFGKVRKDNRWCEICYRRYHSYTYEEHCERKYHKAVVAKQEKLRSLYKTAGETYRA